MTRRIAWIFSCAVLAACAPTPVESVTLTPTGEHAEAIAGALREADARWERAGVAPDRIQIGDDGAPVTLVDSLPQINHEHVVLGETRTRGRGSAFMGVRWMHLASLDSYVVTHEMGHALGIYAIGFTRHHDAEGDCEAPEETSPVMCAVGGGAITELDLSIACEVGDCTHFNPESHAPESTR